MNQETICKQYFLAFELEQALNYCRRDIDRVNIEYILGFYTKKEDFIETLKPMLRKDENGKYGIYTPHVFAMVNGEYVDYEIGLGDYDGSEKAREKAINRYKEIMSYFIEAQ